MILDSWLSNLQQMTLEILTPDKKVFEGEANSVTLPGTMGFFEILNHHAPIISTLQDGKLTVRAGGKEEVFLIKGGVVEALNNKVMVLVEGIEHR
jgi:F-type H+-transporting ATPase subunit epsilon